MMQWSGHESTKLKTRAGCSVSRWETPGDTSLININDDSNSARIYKDLLSHMHYGELPGAAAFR
eukprot:CCRYP_013925-RB/>CCRYP_013925-RB protein AED:0.42 eAED:0.42 QI:903/0/0.5/0.5/0/0/2/0/63